MPASVEILNVPIGSILTSTIVQGEKESKNDFDVLLLFSENVDLTQSGVSVSAGSSIIAIEGANSVWKATIRPPETSGIVTVTVAANAVNEGNSETSKEIRVTRFFSDVDAEEPTLLFNHGLSYSFGAGRTGGGITVSPNRIIVSSGRASTFSLNYFDFFTFSGTHQPSETITWRVDPTRQTVRAIDYINGEILYQHTEGFGGSWWGRVNLQTLEYEWFNSGTGGITHTRLGVTRPKSSTSIFTNPYDFSLPSIDHEVDLFIRSAAVAAAHQNDLLYLYNSSFNSESFIGSNFDLAAITSDDEIEFVKSLNIAHASSNSVFRDIAIFGDTLYLLDSAGVYTLDIKKYRPVAKRTKTTIYPIFVEAGDTIDLTQFSPDAERIVFDVGYDRQPQLSINASNQLAVGSGAQTCFVKLKAINRIDATETESFGFYLIIRRAAAPVWRDVSELTMRANSSYDLFQLVPDADSIAFRSGRTQPTGSRVSNGVFTIGTAGSLAEFTARKGGRSSHIAIAIDVVQEMGSDSSEVSGYRIEIAGIDVTSDSVGFPSVSETLDPVVINEYRVNEASIVLRNEGGKYNSDLAGNFWETNGLNAGGFQNAVKIYLKHLDGSESLHFSGLINESFEPIGEVTFKLNCSDISSRLRKALVQDFGTLEKWDSLRKQSDEDSYEGVYVPERSLLPMQVGTGIARSDRTELAISRLELPSEGPSETNTAYMTPTELRTAGGFLAENPLLRFKGEHRSEDVRFLMNQLAINKEVYNIEIDIPGVEVEAPFLLNRGSVALSVESTRTTRLPVDWVYDSTNARILILLSNPEGHISDQLVQYDINGDSYRVLHTFDKGIAVHRIERRNGTNYYILTSAKIQQDRSARELPRQTDATGYAYDSLAEGSQIKIYHYSTSTGTLTEHVAEDDSHPPQLGIHYFVGFENGLNIDEFEGIRPDYRGAFKWHSNNLYYRYAKDGEFGVARVNTGGTTAKMIGQTELSYNNHLNFAFDINSSGTIYFVYSVFNPLGDITVVNTTPLSNSRTDATITDDLSSYDVPIQLQISFTNVSGRSTQQVRIIGTDRDGTPQTVFVGDTRIPSSSGTVNLDESFLTITEISSINFFTGTYEVKTIPIKGLGRTIKRRTSSGTTSIILQDFQLYENLTGLDDDGGAYLGCHECVFHNSHLYILAQIGRVDYDEDADETTRSRAKTAGMVLYRCDVTAGSPSLTVLEKWDFVHQAGCGLTIHTGEIYFVESPPASRMYKPYNPDLESYNAEMQYNVIEESLGALKKINNAGEVKHLGNVWHTDRPYNVFPTRMLSIDDALHLCAGYGNGDEILRYNSLASQADNIVHIVYGKTLHYVLPRFSPTGSVYAALASLAKSVNATLSFEKNVIMITDRRPYRALTDGATGTGIGNIGFSEANKTFPSSGYLLIGKEILTYTGISGGAFTGITRGVLGSDIINHADESGILYLDTLIQTEKLGSPYKKITLQSDTNRIFNIIRDSGGIAEVRDEESIAIYGERPYTLDLSLTRHEKAWIEEIFRSYLEELKDLQQIVNIQVIPDFSLRLGQIVPFFYKGLISGMRIVSVRYEGRTTHIKGRTV